MHCCSPYLVIECVHAAWGDWRDRASSGSSTDRASKNNQSVSRTEKRKEFSTHLQLAAGKLDCGMIIVSCLSQPSLNQS